MVAIAENNCGESIKTRLVKPTKEGRLEHAIRNQSLFVLSLDTSLALLPCLRCSRDVLYRDGHHHVKGYL